MKIKKKKTKRGFSKKALEMKSVKRVRCVNCVMCGGCRGKLF